ncbi:MAG: response regulator transcription factor [Bdellovibrionia bacterium]
MRTNLVTILIIDDDSTFIDSVSLALRSRGTILRASCFEEARKLFSGIAVDMVISDYRMSRGDGHDVLREVKKLSPQTPVVLVTAFAEKDMAIRSVNLRADGLLEKPIDLVELTQTVDRFLEAKAEKDQKVGASRPMAPKPNDPLVRHGDLVLNSTDLSVSHEGQTYQLTEIEFRILWTFVSSEGKRVSREELLINVWGNSTQSSNLFDTHLTNLKKKLPFLKTRLRAVRGLGYIYSQSPTE